MAEHPPFEIHRRRPRLQVDIKHRYLDRAPDTFSEASFGDLIGVQTAKDIKQPTGMFTLLFTAHADSRGLTWMHRITPMDYVAIFMSGGSPEADGTLGRMEVVMRGFVTNVGLTRTMVNGAPQMVVQVTGHDYGKLFTRANLFHPSISGEGDFLFFGDELDQQGRNAFFYDFWGVAQNGTPSPGANKDDPNPFALDPKLFLEGIVEGVSTSQSQKSIIESYISLKDVPKLHIILDRTDFWPEMKVPLASSTAVLGSVQNLLDAFRSAPWYELYVIDYKEGPRVVWRLTPYKGLDGKLVTLGGNDVTVLKPTNPGTVIVDQIWTLDSSDGRTDTDQYSYFMTLPEAIGSSDVSYRAFYGQPRDKGIGVAIWDRALSKQFGFRPMEVPFPLLWFPNTKNTAATTTRMNEFRPMIYWLNQWLYDVFKDQYLYTSGQFSLAGNQKVRIGSYLQVVPPGIEYYVEAVGHNFQIGRNLVKYDTTVGLVRGRYLQGNLPFPVLKNDPHEPGNPGPVPGINTGTNTPPGPSTGPTTSPTPTPGAGSTGRCQYPNHSGAINGGFNSSHPALDLTAPLGSSVAAPHAGVVIGFRQCPYNTGSYPGGVCGTVLRSGNATESPTYGSYVLIQAPGGAISMLGHTAPNSNIQLGTRVVGGEAVGISDNTGKTTGAHTHWEFRVGGALGNPATTCIERNLGL